jgi:hypothetical protein
VIAQQMWQMRQGELRDARSIATTAFVPRRDDIQNNRACIAINTQGALAALLLRPAAAHVHIPSAANRHGCKMGWLLWQCHHTLIVARVREDTMIFSKACTHGIDCATTLLEARPFWKIHAVVRIHDLVLLPLSKCT